MQTCLATCFVGTASDGEIVAVTLALTDDDGEVVAKTSVFGEVIFIAKNTAAPLINKIAITVSALTNPLPLLRWIGEYALCARWDASNSSSWARVLIGYPSLLFVLQLSNAGFWQIQTPVESGCGLALRCRFFLPARQDTRCYMLAHGSNQFREEVPGSHRRWWEYIQIRSRNSHLFGSSFANRME